MGNKNHGNNKEVQENNKEVIEATVAPEETKADTAEATEDNNSGETTPPEKQDDKEPKKEPSLVKKAANKVKGGVKKVLGKQFTIGQVLGLVAGVGAAVFIGKAIYEKGQNDALEVTDGGDANDDETGYLPVHEDESDDDREEVYDVEESEAEEVEESDDGDNSEVYDEEDEVYDEDMTEE